MVVNEHTSQLATPDRATAGHSRQRPSGGATAPDPDGSTSTQVRQLLDRADALQLRAPELARVLGERAAVLAESAGSNSMWIHAEALAVLSAVRLGYRAETTGRTVTVLRAAENAGEHVLAVRLRTALAVCARSVGTPLTGLAVLRQAVSATGVPGAHRAAALCQLARCVTGVAGKAELDRTFATADRLCTEDGTLAADTKLVQRALLRVGMSVHRRRYGDIVGAADAARSGIGFLDGLDDAASDGGVARARLALELATSSLDRGEASVALEAAGPILARPLRDAEVAPVAWLRLALATRVHLAAGEGYAATRLLRDAMRDTDRHDMRALSAQLRSELAHVEERMGRPGDALEILRDSRADERADARVRGHAYAVLTSEFGAGEQPDLDLGEILAAQPLGTSAAHVAESGSSAQLTVRHDAADEPTSRDEPEGHSAEQPNVEQPNVEQANVEPSSSERSVGRRAEEHSTGSVLDRLGITGGAAERAGGRRRATGIPAADTSAADTGAAGTGAADTGAVDTGAAARGAVDTGDADTERGPTSTGDPVTPVAPGDTQRTGESAEEQVDWLPKLRLPPSLAPVEELYTTPDQQDPSSGSAGDTPATNHASRMSEPGSAGESTSTALESAREAEPAADAGLAELLTRALAEHQSGSSSAQTLVARLGSATEDDDETPRRNGKHRTDGE